MEETSAVRFEGVREWDDAFLALFPHRFDYIFAPYPLPGETPDWQTESRHPLSDRLIRQSAYLYGVRFGADTSYCLLDIDAGSLYHPQRDPFAIARIAAALEPLGLVHYVACTSSYSGGLHLYFPCQETQSSWQLAIAVACLLENAGFKLQPGQLETFPNPKPYAVDGTLSLFNAHRLPLQIGFYLLNEAWQPIRSDTHAFVRQWTLAQQRNDINKQTIKQILKQAKRKHFGISGKAEKFINDLNAEIELGWTGYGQTNRLLGRITMRAYIFHHVLSGGEPLVGNALVDEIVAVAQTLPGYHDWCRHQHELTQRAEEWARCIEHSHYFHFGDQLKQSKPESQDAQLTAAIDQTPSWNQRQSAAARDRIRRAIAQLLDQGQLPMKPTARFQALLQFGIGGASLYRHRDLWHPNYFETEPETADVENPPYPPTSNMDGQLDRLDASNWHSRPSLLPTDDGDNRQANDLSDHAANSLPPPASNPAMGANIQPSTTSDPAQDHIRAAQAAFREASQQAKVEQHRIKLEAAQQRRRQQMQQFLDSGDPILMAEAMAWAEVNPGVLTPNSQLPPMLALPSVLPSDRSTLLTEIALRQEQLGWSAAQMQQALQQYCGKDQLIHLDDSELCAWWQWFSALSPPS